MQFQTKCNIIREICMDTCLYELHRCSTWRKFFKEIIREIFFRNWPVSNVFSVSVETETETESQKPKPIQKVFATETENF